MCTDEGCPVAVEVFEGNTADPVTLSSQIDKLKQRFKLQRVVMVGDRGVLTSARIEQTLRPAGLDWITALRAPAIKQLAADGGPLQPSLFDHRDIVLPPRKRGAEITSPDYPGERLVVCKNPLLAEEQGRKRAELLAASAKDLARIAAQVQRPRRPLRGAAAIGPAVGAVLGRRPMAKHFQITITEDAFSFAQNPVGIASEAALDGIYGVRTNLPAAHCDAPHGTSPWADGPRHGARLQKSQRRRARFPFTEERRSRTAAGVPLDRAAGARPRLAVHAGLLSAVAHAPEPRPDAREAPRTSPVAKAEPSPAARRKAARKRAEPADGEPLPVRSFHSLLGDLATLTRNVVRLGRDHLTAILATPHPNTTPRLGSARRGAHRVDRPTPPLQNDINGLRSKRAKFGLVSERSLSSGSICPISSLTSQQPDSTQPRPRQAPLGSATARSPLGRTALVPDQTNSGSRICASHL